MASNVKPRCGICRIWSPTGETDGEGHRLGYCDEFPTAGLVSENTRCHGTCSPFKMIGGHDGDQ